MAIENEFKTRFSKMLAGRKPTLWIKPLGLSNGTISRIAENSVPGSDILTVMQRAENVNINWLLGTSSRPFMIDTHLVDASFIDYLNYHSEDQDYRLDYLIAENLNTLVVVFSQPASMQFKNKTIGYTHVEVLAGPITKATLKKLAELKNRHNSWEFVLPDIQSRQLIAGEYGTYLLFGDREKKGLITQGIQQPSQHKITELTAHYKNSESQISTAQNTDSSNLQMLDDIHQTLSAQNIKLLPSQINAIAKILIAIGVTGTASLEQIKSAAELAKVTILSNE